MTRSFDAELFRELTQGATLGHPLVWTERTGSTNDDALTAARAGAEHGSLFVTEEQLAGRGRRGNTWHSNPGESLLFSVLLRPNVDVERAPALALVAGLAVRAAVAEALVASDVRERALVKWPNDVVVGGRKLAGILVESQVRGGAVSAVVVGVGLNVGQLLLPDDVAKSATSLLFLGVRVVREHLLAAVLRELEARLAALETPEMPLKSLVAELGEHDALFQRRLTVGTVTGIGSGIDAHGFLRLEGADGVMHRIASGHVLDLGRP